VFAVLMRDAAKWEQLFNNQEDHWGVRSLQLMLTRLGFNPGSCEAAEVLTDEAAAGRRK
jgi:hypothetical protein